VKPRTVDLSSLSARTGNRPKLLFIAGLAFVLTPWVSPPLALSLGLVFGLTMMHPFHSFSRSMSKILLQVCVVGLGFGMNLHEVLEVGRSGFLYTFLSICFVLAAGWALGRLLKVGQASSYLIAVGTAICGGSAIAAVGPVIEATDEELSVSLGTIFILNSVALLIFPAIGRAAGLTPEQFGLWAALAIHDTSSVVGAGIKYGAGALSVATTVKLARALWIAPIALATAACKRSGAAINWPWFILLFIAATMVNTYLPGGSSLYTQIVMLSKIGLIVTLYLIGSNISRATLQIVGVRAFLQGTLLWVIVTGLSLALVYWGIIVGYRSN
jgi:uncharacterized integral membrane protein (TIGR00698 family)